MVPRANLRLQSSARRRYGDGYSCFLRHRNRRGCDPDRVVKHFIQEVCPQLAVVRQIVEQEGLYDPQPVQPFSHFGRNDSRNQNICATGRSLFEALLRAASLLASIRTQGYTANLDETALVALCVGTGVDLDTFGERIAVPEEQILPFLEVIDRRRYEIGLVPKTPEQYRASSRTRLGGRGT